MRWIGAGTYHSGRFWVRKFATENPSELMRYIDGLRQQYRTETDPREHWRRPLTSKRSGWNTHDETVTLLDAWALLRFRRYVGRLGRDLYPLRPQQGCEVTMFCVVRFNDRGWHNEIHGLPTRSEALCAIEGLRLFYGSRTMFRIVVR